MKKGTRKFYPNTFVKLNPNNNINNNINSNYDALNLRFKDLPNYVLYIELFMF